MIRRLLVVCCMVTLGACASKKTAPQSGVPVGDAAADSTISSQNMTFDPSGSDSGKIEGLSTIHFEYDRSAITSTAKSILSSNANWIQGHPDVTVQIEGHCDNRGSIEYNLALGERRARAVKAYLVSLGVSPKKLSVISYGKEKPLVPGDTEQAYAQNRRANFVPLGK